MRLSVPDKYPQFYRLVTQGAQNSATSPQGGFCESNPLNKASTPN